MFKRALSVVLQTVLFWVVFGAGSFLPVFHVLPEWQIAVSATHLFVLDGLVLMVLLYLVILAVEVFRKRVMPAAGLTTLAFILALVLGLAMKFGLVDRIGAS